MRGLSILCAGAIGFPFVITAQTPQQKDSVARADSIARADSLALVRALEKELGANAGVETASAAPAAARAAGGYMNIGFVALTDAGWSTAKDVEALEGGDHDPKVRGFTIPNTELTLDGAVDPFFKGFSSIVFKIEPNGETAVELEEAYVLTTALPANLQIKAGQYFAEFGRQNPQHPHSWAFVDQPLVLNRMLGPEGLRSQGLRLSWLAPTPFYTEALVSVMNATGGTAWSFNSPESQEIHGGIPVDRTVDGLRELVIVPRVATSFDLSDTQTLLVGVSGAFGPNNSGLSARTAVYGVDGYWKWKPAAGQQGFPFVSMQAEGLLRRYDAEARISSDTPALTLVDERLNERGAYAQALWGIKPRIIAGLRGDWVRGDDAAYQSEQRADRFRLSPNLTVYPTEFSKIRMQYNYDDRAGIGPDHSLWFQFEFLIGAHASHKF